MRNFTKRLAPPELIILSTLSTICLQWLVLMNFGPLKFKPFHITLVMLFLYFVLSDSFRQIVFYVVRSTKYFIAAYIIYLFWSIFSIILTNEEPINSFNAISKNIVYFLSFILLSGVIVKIFERKTYFVFILGSFFGIIIFFGYGHWVFDQLERSFALEYLTIFLAGDADFIMFSFYKTLFNFSDGIILDKSSGQAFATSLRNTLMGCFVLFTILALLFRKVGSTSISILGLFIMIIAPVVVVSGVSRSNILIMGLIFGHSMLIYVLKNGVSTKFNLLQFMIIIGVFCTTTVYFNELLNVINPITRMISGRLIALGDDTRLTLFEVASSELNTNWLFGKGYDAKLSLLKKDYDNHNLLLGAWFQFGMTGLMLSATIYLSIGLHFVAHLYNYLRTQNYWKLIFSFSISSGLIIPPIIRTLVGGDNGSLTIVDWIFLSFYFATVIHNDRSSLD